MFRINLNFFKRSVVMRVRVLKKCYYQDRIRNAGTIIEFDEADMDKGVYRAGDKKGKPKPPMPSWAEIVDPGTKEVEADTEEQPAPTTLHEIADKQVSKVAKAGNIKTNKKK